MNTKNLSIFLSIIVLILIALLGYMVLKERTQSSIFTQESVPIEDMSASQLPINNEPVSPVDETANWKTYNFKVGTKFSIKYPPTWAIEEHYTDPSISSSNYIYLTNGSYVVGIGQGDGGGGDCIFSDTKGPINENFDLDLRKVSFTEIYTNMGLLRRYPTKIVFPNSEVDFAFCSQKPNGRFNGAGAFATPVGGITYKLPSNYDPKMLTEMDAIIKTIKQ